jgi:YD repeat-containing protein
VQADIITGDLRVQTLVARLPGSRDWPLLGCTYRSTDSDDGAWGAGRTAGGVLGMKVLGDSNSDDVNVVNEAGWLAYYVFGAGVYENFGGGRNRLYAKDGGWMEVRDAGLYFQYDSNGRLIAGWSNLGDVQYFHYDGSGHYEYVLNNTSAQALYFETDEAGRITSVKDPGGRETSLSYNDDGLMDKVIGPSLCVTYFDYDANGDLAAMTDAEGHTVNYEYDASHRVTAERYGSCTTYFVYA